MNWFKCQDVIDVRDGTHSSPKYLHEGYPLVTSKNIRNNRINFEDVSFISKSDFIEINKRSKVDKGDIIMPMIGTVGNPVLVNTDKAFAIKNVALFKNNDKVDMKYIYYILVSHIVEKQFEDLKRGGTQKFVSLRNIRELRIPLPPLVTQKKIAALLDAAQSLIDKRKAQIALLDELIKSTFYTMFGDPVTNPMGWEIATMDSACMKITDGEHATPQRVEKGIYLLSARNIHNHYMDLDDVDYINDEEYKRIARRIEPEVGDVLISCSGSVGRVCRVKEDFKFQMVRSVAILKLKKGYNAIFIEYMIDTSLVQKQINSSVNQSSQANLFQGKIKKINILRPPTDLQNQFAEKVQAFEAQKTKMQAGLEAMEELFGSLMQRAFSGEIE